MSFKEKYYYGVDGVEQRQLQVGDYFFIYRKLLKANQVVLMDKNFIESVNEEDNTAITANHKILVSRTVAPNGEINRMFPNKRWDYSMKYCDMHSEADKLKLSIIIIQNVGKRLRWWRLTDNQKYRVINALNNIYPYTGEEEVQEYNPLLEFDVIPTKEELDAIFTNQGNSAYRPLP